MNIIEVMKKAQDGERVKRKEWRIQIFIVANAFWIFESTFKYTLDLEDILADDWEVVR